MKKRTWMKFHRWIGLVSLLPFIGLVTTGLVLVASAPITSQQQLTALEQQLVLPSTVKAIERLTAAHSETSITMILPGSRLADDWRVQFTDSSIFWVDPDTGNVKKESSDWHFHQWWLNVHNTLFVGRYGPYFVLLTGFFILMQVISGLLTQSKLFAVIFTKPRFTSLRYWHRSLSLVFSGLLLISCASGMLLIIYKIASQLPYDNPSTDVQQSHQTVSAVNLEAIVETLLERPSPNILQGIMISRTEPKIATVMLLDREAHWWNKSIAFTFDASTGKRLAADPPSLFWKIMVAIKAIHIGIWGSAVTAWLYLFVGFAILFSIVSGLLLWGRRR